MCRRTRNRHFRERPGKRKREWRLGVRKAISDDETRSLQRHTYKRPTLCTKSRDTYLPVDVVGSDAAFPRRMLTRASRPPRTLAGQIVDTNFSNAWLRLRRRPIAATDGLLRQEILGHRVRERDHNTHWRISLRMLHDIRAGVMCRCKASTIQVVGVRAFEGRTIEVRNR